MSSSDNNLTYKKTSFLTGSNSEFINQFYSDYLSDPKSLPDSWKKFFDGLSEDEKLILNDLNGPSWSPEKNQENQFTKKYLKENFVDLNNIEAGSIKQASKDSCKSDHVN